MSITVCKFGGTSMADGNIIKAVKKIIERDNTRRYIVVSAPGKRYSGDIKVTDLLYACQDILNSGGSLKQGFAPVRRRFVSIVKELDCDLDIQDLLDRTEQRIQAEQSEDFTASRGEYLCAQIAAKVFDAKFIDSEGVIFFNDRGEPDIEKSCKAIRKAIGGASRAVFSGFYGTGSDGKVKTFSRGGSDITGAIVACAVNASLYENWTDVSGFLACDPRIVPSPKPIKTISYKELRELSYMGANVLHAESIFPVCKANIPIQIKNTFRPDDEGTSILPRSRYVPDGSIVTGVAGKKNFTVIFIEKSLMNTEVGFIARVLEVLKGENVSVEHIPTGIDEMSLVISNDQLTGKLQRVLEGIKSAVNPDSVRVTENIALVATVGHGMNSSVGATARLFSALAAAGINVKMIDLGSSGMNVIVGVDNADYEKCITAIYRDFFG